MKTPDQNPDEKKRRFLLFLPLLVLPFLLLLIWALGPNQKTEKQDSGTPKNKVNMELPSASFDKVRPQDKMSYYAQATLDSTKKLELIKQDPYFQNTQAELLPESGTNRYGAQGLRPTLYAGQPFGNTTEDRIYRRLDELNTVLNQPPNPAVNGNEAVTNTGPSALSGTDLDRLEQMMDRIQQQPAQGDQEMQQINAMLEKVMAIQHPEQAAEKIKHEREQHRGEIYPVSASVEDDPVTIISVHSGAKSAGDNGFYGLSEAATNDEANAIAAVIHDNQTVTAGSIVKMRLVNDIMIRGELVPKDTYLFGQAQISGERLTIDISSIRYNNSIYPVKLSVYDLDGMDGIHIPGAISRDVAKESGTDAMQGIGINSFDPSLATQAASAGIELSKSLIKKKVKLVRVTLKAGYRLLLKDQRQQTSN